MGNLASRVVAMVAQGFLGVLLGFRYWPSAAIGAISYSSLATSFVGRSFGLVAADWLIKTFMALDRRLVSYRAHSA